MVVRFLWKKAQHSCASLTGQHAWSVLPSNHTEGTIATSVGRTLPRGILSSETSSKTGGSQATKILRRLTAQRQSVPRGRWLSLNSCWASCAEPPPWQSHDVVSPGLPQHGLKVSRVPSALASPGLTCADTGVGCSWQKPPRNLSDLLRAETATVCEAGEKTSSWEESWDTGVNTYSRDRSVHRLKSCEPSARVCSLQPEARCAKP